MIKIIVLMGLLALLTSCNACKKYEQINGVFKTDAMLLDRMEGTPVIFKNSLVYVISNRTRPGSELIEFYDKDLRLIKSIKADADLVSAIVHNDELYIFSTKERKQIEFIKTNDLVSFSEPITVLTAPEGINHFNTSIAFNGEAFTMAYEVCETGKTCFNVRFAQSQDLITWVSAGKTFSPEAYAACPMIRFSKGLYYLTYLRFNGEIYETYISRSKDLKTWQHGEVVLSPKDNKDLRSTNNSDMDMVEVDGKMIIQYAEGNQSSGSDAWVNIRIAEFQGTQEQFLESFFSK